MFPNDIFSLKKIVFVLLLLLNFSIILSSLRKASVCSVYGFVFPLLLWIYSFVLMFDIITPFLRVFCCFMLLLLIPIMVYEIDFEVILTKLSWIIVFVTLTVLILDLFNILDINGNNFLRNFWYNNEIGMMGKGHIYSGYYKIFMKSSPILCFTLFKEAKEKKYIKMILILLTLLVSGTRSNMFFPIAMLIICFFIEQKGDNRRLLKVVFALIMVVISIGYIDSIWASFRETFIEKGSLSDSVRLGHLDGLIESYKRNPINIFIGTGMGSSFYSYGSNSYANSIELSYLDLFRQMGIVFFMAFMYFLIKPLFGNFIDISTKCAYIAYLLIAATNPLLFSSTAFMVYIYIYFKYKKNKELHYNECK